MPPLAAAAGDHQRKLCRRRGVHAGLPHAHQRLRELRQGQGAGRGEAKSGLPQHSLWKHACPRAPAILCMHNKRPTIGINLAKTISHAQFIRSS